MRARTRNALVSTFVATLFIGTVVAQSDPNVGTWTLNVAKSKWSPGPAIKSGTTVITAAGKGHKVTVDQVIADGSKRHYEYTSADDGKEVPIVGNHPDADTVLRTRVDAATTRAVMKKGGKVTTTQTAVLSADGKTRTVTTTGTNAAGQAVNNVAVFEKK